MIISKFNHKNLFAIGLLMILTSAAHASEPIQWEKIMTCKDGNAAVYVDSNNRTRVGLVIRDHNLIVKMRDDDELNSGVAQALPMGVSIYRNIEAVTEAFITAEALLPVQKASDFTGFEVHSGADQGSVSREGETIRINMYVPASSQPCTVMDQYNGVCHGEDRQFPRYDKKEVVLSGCH